MTFESISGDAENTQTSGGISRRSVIKVGAHAAWAVPLVQVVAAAPAFAVSGPPKLAFSGESGSYPAKNSQTLNTSVTLTNTGGGTQSLQVTFTFPSSAWTPSVDAGTYAGWSVDNSGQATAHVFTALTQLASNASVTLAPTFTVKAANQGKAVNISVSVTATGAQSMSTSIVVTGK